MGPLASYRWIVGSTGRPMSWREFVHSLDAMYDNPIVDYFVELTKLKQEGYAFDRYQNEFKRQSHQMRGLAGEYSTSLLIRGNQLN